jgi:ABC-type multidrug transport system ATPase subunit
LTESAIHSAHNSHSESAVILESVSKIFGRFAALHDLTATFPAGRLYALLGENGAGKTTLLRIIAGLSRPSRGTLSVLGSKDVRAAGHRIGYMAHATLLYDELTARENLDYFARLYAPRPVANREELLDAVGLANVDTKRRVGQYSQGMKQRLALARAMLGSPDLLLLDEPFSNVDAKSITAMAALLGLLRDRGATLIVITHQVEALGSAADEWITLHAGTIVKREAMHSAAPVRVAAMPRPALLPGAKGQP